MDASRYIALTRRWWWLLATGMIVAVAAYGVAARLRDRTPEPPQYEASATIFVSLRPLDQAPDASITDRPWDMDRLLATYAQLLRSDDVAQRAAVSLSMPPYYAEDLASRVRVDAPRSLQTIDVRVTAPSPGHAVATVRAVVAAFEELHRGRTLPGDVVLLDAGSIDATPVHGDTQPEWLTVLIVVAAGLLAASTIIVAFEYLSDAVRGLPEAERIAETAGLAAIPLWPARRAALETQPAAVSERFRMLRTNARLQLRDERANVVAVSAPRGGCGTTTCAINYAAALAHAGRRTLLVDANLRTPALAAIFGTDARTGLAEALAEDAPIYGLVHATEIDGLSLIVGGAAALNPAELLESPRLATMLAELRERFDAIVIDTPPIVETADATAVAALADAAMLVVRCDVTTRADTAAAAQMLRRAAPRLLGVVLNADPSAAGAMRLPLPFARRARRTVEVRL